LVEGEVSLLKKTDAEIHSHNYNVALSVGRKDNEINQKVQYYYLRDDKVVHLLPRAKDKFKLIFKGHQEEIAHFMKLNDVKLEKEHHLEALFEHYNSLLAK
jgi:ATP:corrinoid adenosyltransferase